MRVDALCHLPKEVTSNAARGSKSLKTSRFSGTPELLQQALYLIASASLPSVQIYSHGAEACDPNWYQPVHIWKSWRTGSSPTGAGSRSHPGAPPVLRDVGGGGGAPLHSFSPQAWCGWVDGVNSWAWCLKKCTKLKGVWQRQACSSYQTEVGMYPNNVTKNNIWRDNNQVGLISVTLRERNNTEMY